MDESFNQKGIGNVVGEVVWIEEERLVWEMC